LIAGAVEEEIIPGAVLLVAKDGKVLHEKAYGYAQRYDYGKVEKSEPIFMASDQLFDLASLTKVFATTFGQYRQKLISSLRLPSPPIPFSHWSCCSCPSPLISIPIYIIQQVELQIFLLAPTWTASSWSKLRALQDPETV